MEKYQLLEELKKAAAAGQVSKEELLNALSSRPVTVPAAESEKSRLRIDASEVIQYIGGGIVFFGISILIANNWSFLNELTKILATLGSALLALGIGMSLHRQEKTSNLGIAFLLISLLLMPLGVYVTLDAFGIKFTGFAERIGYELILAVTYGISYFAISKKLYIAPFAIFVTSLFFTATNYIIGPTASDLYLKLYEYRFLMVGLSFILLGRYFSLYAKENLPGLFYFFGTIIVLSAGIGLGGYKPSDLHGILWEILYPLLVFAGIFLGIYVKQTKMLIIAALFLMGYILKITGEYFSSGLGWPLALVLAGLLMIGVGYLSLYINRKYIKKIPA